MNMKEADEHCGVRAAQWCNWGGRRNINLLMRKLLSKMSRIPGIGVGGNLTLNIHRSHTMGKMSYWILVTCRERCESSFAFELRLHTGKQHPALSALGAAILSFQNSHTNFAGFIYTKNKTRFLMKPRDNYHMSWWLNCSSGRPSQCFHFTSLQAAPHCEGKFLYHLREVKILVKSCS